MSTGGPFAIDARLTARAMDVDARAQSRGDILPPPKGRSAIYPRYAERAKGAYLWDVDGARYVDFLLGYGTVILGHADERVHARAVESLQKGHSIAPLWSPSQVALCEKLCEVIPSGESAYLLKTGSDATSAAVRMARIYTGRDHVLRWGYNGWHDWTVPSPSGIPMSVQKETDVFDYWNLDDLDAKLSANAGQVACVITMPFGDEVSTAGHLRSLRETAHRHGALFILDEMRSGFRIALGGAQQFFNVQADLATYSKAMANGFPISALVGRRDVMAGFSKTKISSAFYASPVEMAASLETISILSETGALGHVWRMGERFAAGLRDVVAQTCLPATVIGYPPMPFLRFEMNQRASEMRSIFYRHTTLNGILLHPEHQWFISAAHTSEDIDYALCVCESAARAAVAQQAVIGC